MSANDKASATYGPGRTTPPLEARIAEVLMGHAVMTAQHINTKHPIIQCKCGAEVTGGGDKWREHQAAMLAPVIAEAQAEAVEQYAKGWRDGLAKEHPMTTPHPSYVAMTAAWDPERREQARLALARSIDKYTRPTIIRDISKQKRPKR